MVNFLIYPTAETCAMGSTVSSTATTAIQHFNFSSMFSYNMENACLSSNDDSYNSVQYLCLGEYISESLILAHTKELRCILAEISYIIRVIHKY